MSIHQDDVGKLTQLARLALPEQSRQQVATQLDSVLQYVARVSALAEQPAGIEPPAGGVLRPDEVRTGLPVEEGLAAAPDREGQYFRVPRVIE